MTTPTILPETIQASIHQDALSRLPSFFNASIKEILNELLQNSRRAGATRVDITTTPASMTIADDGQGVEDPRTLLAFGQTGWDDATTKNEHPAGMGLYTLARREKVTIRSRSRNGPAWQVRLTPDHFTGKLPAPLEELGGGGMKAGTSITFGTNRNERNLDGEIQEAARHYPLPVHHNGARTEVSDFLQDAVHTETWEGTRIGVFLGGTAKMNFHGVVVQAPPLPSLRDVNMNSWTVRVEVEDCPGLELTLPARKEVVRTPFLEELFAACLRAIYRAMAMSAEPVDVPREVQDKARRAGVTLPDARPRLVPWEAGVADHERHWHQSKRRTAPVDENTLVMNAYLEAADQQTLERAATRNGVKGRLMQGNGGLEGYRWYDNLRHIREVGIIIEQDGEELDLNEMRESEEEPESSRPDGITFVLRGGTAKDPFELRLPRTWPSRTTRRTRRKKSGPWSQAKAT